MFGACRRQGLLVTFGAFPMVSWWSHSGRGWCPPGRPGRRGEGGVGWHIRRTSLFGNLIN